MATTRVATTMMTMVRRFAPPGRIIVVATLVVARELCNSPGYPESLPDSLAHHASEGRCNSPPCLKARGTLALLTCRITDSNNNPAFARECWIVVAICYPTSYNKPLLFKKLVATCLMASL